MENFDKKQHWEKIYGTKQLTEVSWYQPKPEISLNFIVKAGVPKDAAIIDIGGGDSFLADSLLEMGYTDITVLDISEAALLRAKKRLGSDENKIKWIVSDVTAFTPEREYALWHDRAAFHFLTSSDDVEIYISIAAKAVEQNGTAVIGTFSENGPTKCSGINITQYSEEGLTHRFESDFIRTECLTADHSTPFNTIQNFTFCSFKRK